MRHMSCVQGETAEEVAGLAKAMRARCVHVPTAGDVLDIVGTGGDGIGSVNISTGATVIAAAAGAKVAKHGNRSVSSLCGSADVLEVRIAAKPKSPVTFAVSWDALHPSLISHDNAAAINQACALGKCQTGQAFGHAARVNPTEGATQHR